MARPKPVIGTNISPDELRRLRAVRWRCRTDLLYLCNEVLRYRDVVPEVHGPLINILQKFPLPPPHLIKDADIVEPGFIHYKPWLDIYDLPGKRRRLILDPRSGLKTTINCISHTVQWILNAPWATICIFQATGDKAVEILREIKGHFMYNELLRQIFPDICPPGNKLHDWGNSQQFFVPMQDGRDQYLDRYKMVPRKEPTCYCASLDSGTAGKHYDVMKFSDVVDNKNSKTVTGLTDVISTFRLAENVLQRPDSWMDVEGTRYHFNDLYGNIIDKWLNTEEFEGFRDQWDVHVRSCFIRKEEDGTPQTTFTPDDLSKPFLLDANGKRISWWPTSRDGKPRFTTALLEMQERDDPGQFSNQRLNHPVNAVDAYFPWREDLWIDRDEYWKLDIAYHTVTVDSAETISGRSDFSCILVTGWDAKGRGIVHDIRWGRFKTSEMLDHVFDVNARYRPRTIYVEETGYVRGLKGEIERRQLIGCKLDINGRIIKPNTYLPLEFFTPDNQQRKLDRIQLSLEPWWKAGNIIFLSDLGTYPSSPGAKDALVRETERFPKGHDDILDCLSQQFVKRGWYGRERALPNLNDLAGITDPDLGVLVGPKHYDASVQANSRIAFIAQRAQERAFDYHFEKPITLGGDDDFPNRDPRLSRLGA